MSIKVAVLPCKTCSFLTFSSFSLQKLKRKIDSVSGIDVNNTSSTNNNTTSTTPNAGSNLPEASVFNFENNDHSAAKISKNSSTGNHGKNNNNNINNNASTNGPNGNSNNNGGSGGGDGTGNNGGGSSTTSSSVNTSSAVGPGLVPRVSVQIVQQISGLPQQDASQTIHTNVTVTGGGGVSPNGHSVHTSFQCKQEPASNDESSQQHLRPNSNNSNGSNNNTPAPVNVNQQQQFHQNSHQNFNHHLNSKHHHQSHDTVGNIGGIPIDDVDVDELQNILESIEKTEHTDPSLLKALNDFDEVFDRVQRNSESGESAAAMYGSQLSRASPGALSNASSNGGGNVFPSLGNMFDTSQPMANVPSGPNIPMSGTIPEPTGPAAETLKQLAAHHQHQQHGPVGGATGYGMKGSMMGGDPFSDSIGGLRPNGGFPPTYPQIYRPHGPSPAGQAPGYPSYDNTAGPHHGMGQMTPEMAAAMGYNTTKPLSHFQSGGAVVGNGPPQMGTHPPHNIHHSSPSSLQQLQNQVQSHFKPGPGVAVGVSGQGHQLQMSQSQHMQVSHGPHSLQMSQTQQVHIQQQQQHQQASQQQQHVTLSQQQNFSISQQQMVSEQVKMQMMEKMRMEQQQQHHHHQQQHQQHPHHHQRMPPQYMGRPPPEYKMHPNARHGPYTNAKPGTGGVMGPSMNANTSSNPLQTMQNMVNQTTAYGNVKTEVVTASTTVTSTPGSGMQPQQQQQGSASSSTTQITAVQQQAITMTSSNMGSNVPQQPGGVNGTVVNRPGFNPQMQQPPAYSSSLEAVSSSSTISRSHTSSSASSASAATPAASSSPSPPSTAATPSTYTSAIMRNQRPPNVNVGPDGLNISQSRPHADWSVRSAGGAGPMMQGGMRQGMSHPGAAGMQGGHMMQYGARPPHYGAPSNMAAAAAAAASNMAQLQQQGQVGGIRAPGMRSGAMMGGAGGGGGSSQMMMQHQQTMHMSQQMAMHASSTGYSMSGPSPGGASGPNAGYALGGPSPGAPSSDYSISGPTGGTPGATAGYAMGGPSPGLTQTANPGYAMGGPSPGAGPGSNHGAYGMGGPSPGLPGSSVGGYPMGGPSPGGANTPMHAAARGGGGAMGSNQQPSAVQPTGYPPPSTSTPNQDAFLHFLDNPLSSQPMFDSIQTSTPDDFNLLEDILNCNETAQ